MIITLVVPRYLPHLGGIENHVAALALQLRARGHVVTVATQRGRDEPAPREETAQHGLTIRRFSSAASVRGQGVSVALWRWLSATAAETDVIHVHNYHALATLPGLALAGPRTVFTPHYLGRGEGRFDASVHRMYAAAARRALRDVHTIICTTPSESRAFQSEVGGGTRCMVVPNGVDGPAIRRATPADGLSGRLVVSACRLEGYKQPHLVLEALRHLDTDHRLALIGSGPMERALRRRAEELGLTGRVVFPGRLAPDEVYRWYKAADVVVSMSRRECFGLTVAEAWAAGSAVVASDIPPHRDVAGSGASLRAVFVSVDARPEDVAEAIRRAAEQPGANERSVFTWADMATAVEKVYAEVLMT